MIGKSSHSSSSVISDNSLLIIYPFFLHSTTSSISLQQLLDAGQYRYRFSVLRKLGVEEKNIGRLVLRLLGVWFGLPVTAALLVSGVMSAYFIQSVSAEIDAYIASGVLGIQILSTVCVLGVLLACYFISTWILFRRAAEKS